MAKRCAVAGFNLLVIDTENQVCDEITLDPYGNKGLCSADIACAGSLLPNLAVPLLAKSRLQGLVQNRAGG
jgi:hypothetical protein